MKAKFHLKSCKVCKKEFISVTNKRYCSKKCNEQFYKEYYRDYNKEYREKNSIYIKNQRLLNSKYHIKKTKEWRKKNKQKSLIYAKNYYIQHKKQILEQKKKYKQIKRRTDINFKLKDCLRHRLYCALMGYGKLSTTMRLIGCDMKKLKTHLESQFKLGMTWQNYGTGWNGRGMEQWHIDHIRPCASFDLSKPSEQRKCFHYTNLQPLWAEDNFKKGYKI